MSLEPPPLTRRGALRLGAGVLVGAGMSPLLAACSGGSNEVRRPQTVPTSGTPSRGGRLTVGVLSAGNTETTNPFTAYGLSDYPRVHQTHETLWEASNDLTFEPLLLEEGLPNKTATEWTLRLKEGVTFSDGKDLTADDLAHSIRLWADPNSYAYTLGGDYFDAASIRKLDNRTVRVRLNKPVARLQEVMAWIWFAVVRDGDDPARPSAGTGPFVLSDFKAGSYSLMTANTNYWRGDGPYFDELYIDSSFTDDNARTNALLSGQIDVAPNLPYAQAKQPGSNINLLSTPGTNFMPFNMRIDEAPFNDVRVRQAMRLLCDRQQMVDNVYQGLGSVGNDIPGQFCEFFASDLTRERDVDQAMALLKAAGQENLRATLQTSTAVPGFTEAAALLQSQAKDASVNLSVKREDAARYFEPSELYTQMTFSQDSLYPAPSLHFNWRVSLLSNSSANATHWNGPNTAALFDQANATLDTAKAAELWRELQIEQFDEGGMLVWGTSDFVDGYATDLAGAQPSKYSFCENWQFWKVWRNA